MQLNFLGEQYKIIDKVAPVIEVSKEAIVIKVGEEIEDEDSKTVDEETITDWYKTTAKLCPLSKIKPNVKYTLIYDLEILDTNLFLDDETGGRKETNARYWLLKRG